MKRRPRMYLSAAQRSEIWDRWQAGESMKSIGRLIDRGSSSVFSVVEHHRAGVAILLLQEAITSGIFRLQRILEPNMVEHRRAAAAKALARAASMGIAVDGDPKFAELVEERAAGHITMREARDQ